MDHLRRQQIGGVAALSAAATFVFGFALFATLLSDYTTGDPTPGESVAFVADNELALYVWNLVILIVFGVVLVPLVLALHERSRSGAPFLAGTALAFGLIWAGLVIAAGMIANIGLATVTDLYDTSSVQAAPVWSALDAVQNGIGGGNEIVGGLWVLLASRAAMESRALPRALSRLGIVAGAAGIATVIPALEAAGAIFGLGLIAWFAWAGAVMLRHRERPAAPGDPERAEGGAHQLAASR
jgi:hypothetical protein